MNHEPARRKLPTPHNASLNVMQNSTVFILAHVKALCGLSHNVLVSIKQVNQTHYYQTSQLHDVIQLQFPSLKPWAGISLLWRGKSKQ